MIAEKLELAGVVGRHQLAQEQAPEQAGEDRHRQEITGPARDQARPIERDATARHDHVDIRMVTGDGLLIRETKFRKTRLVPLHDTAAAGLQRYLARRRPRSDDDPIFIGKCGGPLRYIAVKETFDRLVSKAGIVTATRRRPRLHDLRHTFAVRALQGSPAGRSRSGAHMAALSTYMGHVNIYATYWYLEATADLMRDVAAAGEGFIYDGGRS